MFVCTFRCKFIKTNCVLLFYYAYVLTAVQSSETHLFAVLWPAGKDLSVENIRAFEIEK